MEKDLNRGSFLKFFANVFIPNESLCQQNSNQFWRSSANGSFKCLQHMDMYLTLALIDRDLNNELSVSGVNAARSGPSVSGQWCYLLSISRGWMKGLFSYLLMIVKRSSPWSRTRRSRIERVQPCKALRSVISVPFTDVFKAEKQ